MASDGELLVRYVNDHSGDAFRELVNRHIDFVYSSAKRLAGSDARAADITQTVFSDLSRKARTLTGRADIVGWLYTSVGYASKTLRRTEVRRQTREREAQRMLQINEITESADPSALRPLLDAALATLRPAEREAVLLRYFTRRSFAEVGSAQGLSEEAARKRIARCMEKLRAALARRGVVSSAAALDVVMASEAAVTAPAAVLTHVAEQALATPPASIFAMALTGPAATSLAVGLMLVASVPAVSFGLHAWQAAEEARLVCTVERIHLAASEHARDVAVRAREQTAASVNALALSTTSKRAAIRAALGQAAWKSKLSPEQWLDKMLALVSDPEFRKLASGVEDLIQERINPESIFLQKATLSPEALARFRALAHVDQSPHAMPKVQVTKYDDGHGQITISFENETTIDQDQLKTELGPDAYALYNDISKTFLIRSGVVDKLIGNLLYSGQPLTASQADRLTEVLAQTCPDPNVPNPMTIDWEKALPAARPLLSAKQWDALARLSGKLSTTWNEDAL